MLNSQVGKEFRENDNIRKENFVKVVALPNGNKEYWYKLGKICRYIFEVDSKTQIIVSARFEGTDDACAIVP